ncbi:putative sucrose:sucrose fructosyltransferase [Helianthus anomalus]
MILIGVGVVCYILMNSNECAQVDHSVVESFAQGGRTVITSRVYPTKAIYEAAKVFLFNNGTSITVKASLKIWKMGGAKLNKYPF